MKHMIKAGLTGGLDIIASYLIWINRYAKNPDKRPFTIRYKKVSRLTRHILRSFSVDLIEYGKENIPETTCCFFPNHQSNLDAVALLSSIKNDCSFVAKKEVEKTFLIGKITKILNVEYMEGNDLRQSLKLMDRVSLDLKQGNKNWIIFPEGTRSRELNGPMLDFHNGSFKAAMKANVPLVPVAIYGASRITKMGLGYKRFPIQISYLKPINPKDYEGKSTQEVAKMAQEMVEREIVYHLRIMDHKFFTERKYKKYRFNRIY